MTAAPDRGLAPERSWLSGLWRDHRIGYTAAVASVFWFLACQPAVLLTQAVLAVERLAESRRQAEGGAANGAAALKNKLPKPSQGTSTVLMRRMNLAGERRIAVLQRLEQRRLSGDGGEVRTMGRGEDERIAWPFVARNV